MRQGKNLSQLSPMHAEAVKTLPHAAATADGPIIPGCTPFTHPSLLSFSSPLSSLSLSRAPHFCRSCLLSFLSHPSLPCSLLSPLFPFSLALLCCFFCSPFSRPPRERWRMRRREKSEREEEKRTKTTGESARARTRVRAQERERARKSAREREKGEGKTREIRKREQEKSHRERTRARARARAREREREREREKKGNGGMGEGRAA